VVWPQNHWDGFSQFGLKTGGNGFSRFGLKTGGGGFPDLGLKTGSYGLVIWDSKLPRQFGPQNRQLQFGDLSLKHDSYGLVIWVKKWTVQWCQCVAVEVRPNYPSLVVTFLLAHRGILVLWFLL
jgi:hypothetical protein